MRLLIISHTPHVLLDGRHAGWGPTVREIDYLAGIFSEVVHLAPVHEPSEELNSSAVHYRAPNVRVRPVRPAGGFKWQDKLKILTAFPHYAREILQASKRADVIHVRCPANISFFALVLLAIC